MDAASSSLDHSSSPLTLHPLPPACGGRGNGAPLYWQPGNLTLEIRVDQLNDPVVFRYSVVNQNVQSSDGSTAIAL